jgi:Flp pilus assembly pilin Flp
MGFFKKIVKGVKKVFKKVGKAVKSAVKSVGKFMGKIGIVGQLAVGLFMPYAFGFLGTGLNSFAQTLINSGNIFAKGAGHFLNSAIKVGTRVGQAFSSVSEAVTETVGQMVGATLNKIPGAGDFIKSLTDGRIDITGAKFGGEGGAWEATQKAWTNAGEDLGKLFSKSTFDSSLNKFEVDRLNKQYFDDKEFLDTAQPDFSGFDDQEFFNTAQPEFSGPVETGRAIVGDDAMTRPFTDAELDTITAASTDATKVAEQESFMQQRNKALTDMPAVGDIATQAVDDKYSATNLGTKTAELAEDLGVPTTGTQVVKSLLDSDQTSQNYVDRRSTTVVQGGGVPNIYAAISGTEYGDMLSSYSPQYNAPSMVDAILNQDWGNIYGQGYFGFPSLQAGIANSAGR